MRRYATRHGTSSRTNTYTAARVHVNKEEKNENGNCDSVLLFFSLQQKDLGGGEVSERERRAESMRLSK